MWVGVLSPTRRMSCLSSQRMTSGPSSDSALKTPRRAMRTAAASWSNDDSMCWIWDCASAQLLSGGKKRKKVEVEVNMGVVWMTHTGWGRRCQNQQECKYLSLRGQYWPIFKSQVCFVLHILRVYYNIIQVWDRNNLRLQLLLPGDGGDPNSPLCVGVLILGNKLDRPPASLGNRSVVLPHKDTSPCL